LIFEVSNSSSIEKAMVFLTGNNGFVGRDSP